MSEPDSVPQKGRSRASPISSVASKKVPSSMARRTRLGAQGLVNPQRTEAVAKDPVIKVKAPGVIKIITDGGSPKMGKGDRSPTEVVLMKQISPHDIIKHDDIQLALRFEAAQRALSRTGGVADDSRYKNFTGDIRNVMRQTSTMRAKEHRPPSGCPAFYSRLSCQSGKVHAESLKRVQKRKDFDQRVMSSSKPMREMMQIHLQYCPQTRNPKVVEQPSFENDHQ